MRKAACILMLLLALGIACAGALAEPMTIDLDAMTIEELEELIEMAQEKKEALILLAAQEDGTLYIGNKNTKKFHESGCSSVADMKTKNRVEFDSREAAIDKGYAPCKKCNP